MAWLERLHADPLPWLLAEDTPAVRAAALQCLLDRPVDDGDVRAARAATMTRNPIKAILDAQSPAGWWVKPGPGYATKYRGTVWQVIFLDQLGADPDDERVRRGCSYVLAHSIALSGGFASSGSKAEAAPPPLTVIHCLNGNLLAALIGSGTSTTLGSRAPWPGGRGRSPARGWTAGTAPVPAAPGSPARPTNSSHAPGARSRSCAP